MKHSTSLHSIQNHARKTKQITKNIAIKASDFSTYFSLFLANSRGKDKLLSLLQYIFDFMHTCGRYSRIPELKQAFDKKQLLDMLIYYNLKQNISSARKVFRLFRFFDEIKGLAKIIKTNRPLLFKILSVFTYFCSCSYYICDNSLWFLGVLIRSIAMAQNISKQIRQKYRAHRKDLKRRKNTFSLFRVVAYTIILLYSIFLDTKQSWQMVKDLKKLEPAVIRKQFQPIPARRIFSHISPSLSNIHEQNFDRQFDSVLSNDNFDKKQFKTISNNLIEIRRRIRFYYLQLTISILRMIMLTSSLKLPYHDKLDPVFVGCCGLFSSCLNFIKTLFEKKIILKVDKEGLGKKMDEGSNKKEQSLAFIEMVLKKENLLNLAE